MAIFQDYTFWFTQPSYILTKADYVFGYFFAACFALSVSLFVLKKFTKHEIKRRLISKFFYLSLNIGITGLIWYGIRYENTPIFSMHFWAGLILLIGLIWLGFVLKYLFFDFSKEKREYDHEQVKSRYIPSPKTR